MQPSRQYEIDPVKIFGPREFSKIYVNAYGTVSFDHPQHDIVQSDTFTSGNFHQIIFAPFWAKVAEPNVKVDTVGDNVVREAVNEWISENVR